MDKPLDYWSFFAGEARRVNAPLYERLSTCIGGNEELRTFAGGVRTGQPPANVLFGAVHLRNSQYTIDLQSVHVDMKTGTYNTQEPVTVVTNSGLSIAADSASMRDNGREASFEGRVKSVIRSNAAGPGAAEAVEGAKP